MRPNPFARVDHAALERSVDLAGWSEDHSAARLGDDFAAEAGDAHLEAAVIADRVDLLSEPSRHLWRNRRARARHEVEGGVRLLPQTQPIALVVPRGHARRV